VVVLKAMNEDNKHIEIDLLTRDLAGETNKEEQEYIRQWKDASKNNKQLYNELMEAWLAIDKTTLQQNIDIDAEWNNHVKRYNPASRRTQKTIALATVFKIAASILILIGFSYFGWNYFSKKTIKTDITEIHALILPDGSKATINAGSKLTYKKDYGKEYRTVTLEGEAFFEVEKNPQSPFIIKLDGAEVKVLGTSFNVKAYKDMDKIEVTVSEGKVTVYEKGQEANKVIVTNGEKAIYDKQLKIVQKEFNENRNFIAWKTRLMIFENDNLSIVTKVLSDVYHKPIIIQNPEISHCPITTIFDNKDLDTVLKVLKSTLDLVFEEKNGVIYIKGKGC
jgi:transmembrane sensor